MKKREISTQLSISEEKASAKFQETEEAESLENIALALKQLRFRKAMFGVDEQDVWVKLLKIDEMYRDLYYEQEIKYRTLLKEREEVILKYRKMFAKLQRDEITDEFKQEMAE